LTPIGLAPGSTEASARTAEKSTPKDDCGARCAFTLRLADLARIKVLGTGIIPREKRYSKYVVFPTKCGRRSGRNNIQITVAIGREENWVRAAAIRSLANPVKSRRRLRQLLSPKP
jgi:hypothetical protein